MDNQPFKNHYCPHCLLPVDPAGGGHWDGCEYEASFNGWVNPIQPLTERGKYEKLLEKSKQWLKNTRKEERDLKKSIVYIESEIDRLTD